MNREDSFQDNPDNTSLPTGVLLIIQNLTHGETAKPISIPGTKWIQYKVAATQFLFTGILQSCSPSHLSLGQAEKSGTLWRVLLMREFHITDDKTKSQDIRLYW